MAGSFPFVPNRPGLCLEVVVWTGKVRPKVRKAYLCKSSRSHPHPDTRPLVTDEQRRQYVSWEISQTFPAPEPDGSGPSWRRVRQARVGIEMPETDDAGRVIRRIICEDFSNPSRVQMQVRFIGPPEGG